MDADFWHDMWASGEVGFHQKQINAFLETHWPEFQVAAGCEVLVPLCGKSLDMLWLKSQGHSVLGVELSQKALDEFLAENNLQAQEVTHSHYCGYEFDDMRLFCGDFFQLSKADCQKVKAVYDRAALIALPAKMREKYVAHIRSLLPKGSKILLVTMEYEQTLMQGPPFAVMQTEVEKLYQGVADIKYLSSEMFERKGHQVEEKVYQITL